MSLEILHKKDISQQSVFHVLLGGNHTKKSKFWGQTGKDLGQLLYFGTALTFPVIQFPFCVTPAEEKDLRYLLTHNVCVSRYLKSLDAPKIILWSQCFNLKKIYVK